DLYFTDNGIDGLPDPPQADELNVIRASQFDQGVIDFGYPNCYIQFGTGNSVGSGCTQPLAAFQPINGHQSLGAAQLVLAPTSFPAGFNNGVFIGFSGTNAQDKNPVIYYDFGTGQYTHFIEETTMGHPIGLLADSNSLFISDWGTGNVFEIVAQTPEPASVAL